MWPLSSGFPENQRPTAGSGVPSSDEPPEDPAVHLNQAAVGHDDHLGTTRVREHSAPRGFRMDRAGDPFAGLEGRPQRLCEHGRRDLVMGLAHGGTAWRYERRAESFGWRGPAAHRSDAPAGARLRRRPRPAGRAPGRAPQGPRPRPGGRAVAWSYASLTRKDAAAHRPAWPHRVGGPGLLAHGRLSESKRSPRGGSSRTLRPIERVPINQLRVPWIGDRPSRQPLPAADRPGGRRRLPARRSTLAAWIPAIEPRPKAGRRGASAGRSRTGLTTSARPRDGPGGRGGYSATRSSRPGTPNGWPGCWLTAGALRAGQPEGRIEPTPSVHSNETRDRRTRGWRRGPDGPAGVRGGH